MEKGSKKEKKNIKFDFKLNKKNILIISALAVSLVLVFGIKVLLSKQSYTLIDESSKQNRFLDISSNYKNYNENKDRVNILIGGVGGENHDGGMLTDTILILSIDTKTKKAAILSVPRDLYVNLGPNYGYQKINNANAFGEMENPGKGMELLKTTLEDALGENIQYYVRLDFSAFKQIIDILGGVTINVERSFVDEHYPTDDYLYQTVIFKTGSQVMDGDTALKYARSRHGNNGEGSDFARSARQEKVMLAIKEKVLALGFSPVKILELLNTLSQNIKTDVEYKDLFNLYKIATNIDTSKIKTKTLSESSGYVYITKTQTGASIIKPVGNNFDLIKDLFYNILDENYQEPLKKFKEELPKAIILNGTVIPGLANKVAEEFKTEQYLNTILVGNNDEKNIENTIVYDISEKLNLEDISKLSNKLNFKTLSNRVNLYNTNTNNIVFQTEDQLKVLDKLKNTYTAADLVIILGSDYKK